MTHPSVLGRYGLTAEVSAGDPVTTYPVTQCWAERLYEAGFAGVHYATRHDPGLGSRSIALFGKPTIADDPITTEDDWREESVVTVEPIPLHLLEELTDEYRIVIVAGGPSL